MSRSIVNSSVVRPSPLASSKNPFGVAVRGPLPSVFGGSKEPARAEERTTGETYYAIRRDPSVVAPVDLDSSVRALEVRIAWGDHDVLSVKHLAPARDFVVGEASPKEPVDFELGTELLGARVRRLVAVGEDGQLSVRVPSGARCRVVTDTDVIEHEALMFRLVASHEEAGCLELKLAAGEAATVHIGSLTFTARGVLSARPVAVAKLRVDRALAGFGLGVTGLVLGSMLALSALAPDGASLGGDALRLDDRYVQALIQARQEDPTPPSAPTTHGGETASGPSGATGDRNEPTRPARPVRGGDHAPAGPTNQTASNNVVVNAVAQLAAMFSAPSGGGDAYTAAGALEGDAMGALSALVGTSLSSGGTGLSMTGPGGGGGGPGGEYIRAGEERAVRIGDRYGNCTDGHCDIGPRTPVSVRVPQPTVDTATSGLTADAIRRVIQRNVQQVQHCYEQGLQRNPALSGRVTVSFLISPTGAVQASSADQSLGDGAVSSCVAGAVRRWSFPASDTGAPTMVRFPFTLSRI